MKKILFLMAACFTLVACGGEQKKNDKNNDATEQSDAKKQDGEANEQKDEKKANKVDIMPQAEAKAEFEAMPTDEAKAEKSGVDYLEAQMKAMEANDVDEFVAIAVEMKEWQENLSEEELAEQQKEAEAWFKVNEKRYMELYNQFITNNMETLIPALQEAGIM